MARRRQLEVNSSSSALPVVQGTVCRHRTSSAPLIVESCMHGRSPGLTTQEHHPLPHSLISNCTKALGKATRPRARVLKRSESPLCIIDRSCSAC